MASRIQNEERLRWIEEATDLPLVALALILIPLLVGPIFFDVSGSIATSFLIGDWLIWAVFAVDFGAKLAVAPQRWRYLRTLRLEAAMVALPVLRPIRVLRLLRLMRIGASLGFDVQVIKRLASHRGTKFALAALLTILVFGAGGTLLAERQAEGANIHSFGDSLWWAVTTMTTVGYGDRFPVTPAGRGIAVALMLFGIAALSVFTASITAFLVREPNEISTTELMRELEEIESQLARLRADQPE